MFFFTKCGVPQCVVDGCHVPITSPAIHRTDYYNRKGFYSIILQGVVDHSYCFIDTNFGWPGSVHDTRVFAHSSLYKNIMKKNLLPHKPMSIGGVDIPFFLIGDSAYPVQTWLMKPFTHGNALTLQQNKIQLSY